MLTIISGEDVVASRQLLQKLKQNYITKGFRVQNVPLSEIEEVKRNSEGVVDLFGQESVYVVENISSKYKGRGKTDFKTTVEELSKNSKIHLLDWEEGKSAYDLTSLKKLASTFNECKPAKNIFQLLESCYPGNLKEFLATLYKVHEMQDIMFIYTLLWRHVRKLILAHEGLFDSKTAPWQRGKLSSQARAWDQEKLVKFYEGLVKIDLGMKTSTSTFDIRESIEILACYYLK